MDFLSLNNNIKIRLFCGFITRLLNLMVYPFMAVYFLSFFSSYTTGLIITTANVIAIIANLLGGYVADKIPLKKIILFGTLSNGICLLLIGILMTSLTDEITWIAGLFLANSFLSSFHKPASASLLVQSSNSENRKQIYSYDYWLLNLSVAIGITLGGNFFTNSSGMLYVISGIITVIVAFIYGYYIEDIIPPKTDTTIFDFFKVYKTVLKDYKYSVFMLCVAVIFSSEWHLTNFVSAQLKMSNYMAVIGNFHFDSVKTIALLQLINTCIIVFLTLPVSYFTKKIPTKITLILGMLVYFMSFISMMVFKNIFILIFLMAVGSMGELIFAPSYQIVQIEMIDFDKKGAYLAFGSIAIQSASIFASLLLILSNFVSDKAIMLSSLSACLLALYLIMKISPKLSDGQ